MLFYYLDGVRVYDVQKLEAEMICLGGFMRGGGGAVGCIVAISTFDNLMENKYYISKDGAEPKG